MPNPFRNLFAQPAPTPARTATENMLAELEVGQLRPDPDQPRKSFNDEELADLGQSLSKRQLQPVVARYEPSVPSKPWMLVDGERRWRAAQKAGMHTLQAILIREELTREQRLEMQLIANLFRDDLKPIEQAHAYRSLMVMKKLNAHELSIYLHLSAATVGRALALLELPAVVQDMVDAGQLAPTTAYEVGKAPPQVQVAIAEQAASGGWTRTEVKAAVQAARINPEPARERPSLTLSGSDVGLPDLPDSEPAPVEPQGSSMRVIAGVGTGPTSPPADYDSTPVETLMTYSFCDAEVTVRFPRPASTVEVVTALEGCLEQARLALAPLRLAA